MRRFGTFVAMLAVGSATLVGSVRPSAAVTIPEVDVATASVQEGDAGSMLVSVPVTLSAPAATTVKVAVAVPGKSVTVSFLPGVVQKPVKITIVGDTAIEPNQTVPVTLTALKTQNAVLGVRNGGVTVVDDDANGVPSAPEVAVGGVAMVEGDATSRTALVPVTLSAPATATTKVQFTTNCGGLSTNEYTPVSTTLSFGIGQRIKMVAVQTKPDLAYERNESVGDQSTKNGTSSASQLSIVDDDAPGVPADPTPPAIGIRRVSEVAPGVDPNFLPEQLDFSCGAGIAESRSPSITADGRYVVFESNATDLVPNDTNGQSDIFLKDLQTEAIERISVRADGSQWTADSFGSRSPTITPDGRYVMFWTNAKDIIPGAPSTWWGYYIVDRQLHTVEAVTMSADARSTGQYPINASLSDDGRYVAFSSPGTFTTGDAEQQYLATNIMPDGTVGSQLQTVTNDVFVKDRQSGAITLITDGVGVGYVNGSWVRISGDGRTVVFEAMHYDAAGAMNDRGLFAKDLVTGAVDRVDVNNSGDPSQGWGLYFNAQSVSADGQYVTFIAEVCNLGVPCNAVGRSPMQIYLRDRVAHTTRVVSLDANGQPIGFGGMYAASLSATGRYLVFATGSGSFQTSYGETACGDGEVFVRDLVADTTVRVDVPIGGGCGYDDRYGPGYGQTGASDSRAITADGRSVVFSATTGNLVPYDHDTVGDVFVNRRW